VAWLAAFCMESAARVTGGTPVVPLNAVRMARKRMYFSAAKAVRELGLPQTPAEDALRDAVTWFVERGYAPRPAQAA
jgi:dihydroflavonol-4-reductase